MVERDTSRRVGALLIVGAPSLVGLSIGADFWYLTLGYAVGAVLLVGLLVALHRGRTTSGDILRVLVGLGLFLFALASWSIVEQQATPLETGFFVFRSVVLVSGVAFVAFRPGTAVVISLGLIACGGALLVARGVTLIGGSDLRVGIVETLALLLAMVAIHRSMSVEAERMEQSAEAATISAELAFVDELTGLPNRRQMQSLLAAGLARTAAGAHPDAVLMFDLDHFKRINDSLGHDVGDEVLQRTAAVASAAIRDGDVVGRWGGEEFVALLLEADESQARAVAERCRRALEAVGGALVDLDPARVTRPRVVHGHGDVLPGRRPVEGLDGHLVQHAQVVGRPVGELRGCVPEGFDQAERGLLWLRRRLGLRWWNGDQQAGEQRERDQQDAGGADAGGSAARQRPSRWMCGVV